jgi:hypothetical protein
VATDATDVYGQTDFTVPPAPGTTQSTLTTQKNVAWMSATSELYVADSSNNRVMIFGVVPPPTPTPTPGGGGRPQTPTPTPPVPIGFFPDRITINNDDSSTDSKNVLVNIVAHFNNNFTGTVDVLLSNTPDFSTTIPFRYTIPDLTANADWPKTIAWDLCFGLPRSTPCDPGRKVVYARFYVNLPGARPAFTPLPPVTAP